MCVSFVRDLQLLRATHFFLWEFALPRIIFDIGCCSLTFHAVSLSAYFGVHVAEKCLQSLFGWYVIQDGSSFDDQSMPIKGNDADWFVCHYHHFAVRQFIFIPCVSYLSEWCPVNKG